MIFIILQNQRIIHSTRKIFDQQFIYKLSPRACVYFYIGYDHECVYTVKAKDNNSFTYLKIWKSKLIFLFVSVFLYWTHCYNKAFLNAVSISGEFNLVLGNKLPASLGFTAFYIYYKDINLVYYCNCVSVSPMHTPRLLKPDRKQIERNSLWHTMMLHLTDFPAILTKSITEKHIYCVHCSQAVCKTFIRHICIKKYNYT